MPSWITELTKEENGLFLAMLEIRASERAAGRNTDIHLHGNGLDNPDYQNIHLDVHL